MPSHHPLTSSTFFIIINISKQQYYLVTTIVNKKMGRRKIEIEPLTDDRNRTVTFVKRKAGLFKKLMN